MKPENKSENLSNESQAAVLVEEQKEKLNLYDEVLKEAKQSQDKLLDEIDRQDRTDVHEREREREEYETAQRDAFYAPDNGYEI